MNNSVYQWPDGKRCAAAFSIDFDGESPYLWRSRHTQPNTLGELEQRAFGPRQGIYRIIDMLSRLDIRASFFIPGVIADRYPEAVEAIAKAGHEIGLHGYLHERVDELTTEQIEESIVSGKEAIERIIGPRTMGFRSPSWEMTPETFELLRKHQIPYDSSMMGYDHPYWMDGLPEIPVQWLLDDAIFFRYTGGLTGIPPLNPNVVADTWLQEFEGIKRYGGLFMLTVHCWISGRGSRIIALEKLLTRLKNDPEVWWGTCGEIAAHHRKHNAAQFHESVGGLHHG